MSLNPNVVAKIVKGWSMIFPGNRTAEELAFISAKFHKALTPVYNDKAFIIAAEMIELETEYFPTIKGMSDLRNAVYQVRDQQIATDLKALPEETDLTEEEIERNKEKVKIISDMLAGKMNIEEAIKRQKALEHFVAK